MSRKIKQKSFNAKGKILDIAEDLFVKYSYNAVSMNDIAKRVGITKAALYYHFKSKQDLYFYILEEAFNDFIKELSEVINSKQSLDKRFHLLIVTYLDFCFKKRDLSRLMMQRLTKKDKKIIIFLKQLKDKIVKQLEPIVREVLHSSGKKKVDSLFTTYLLIGALNTFVTTDIIRNSGKWDAEQIANQLKLLVFSKL